MIVRLPKEEDRNSAVRRNTGERFLRNVVEGSGQHVRVNHGSSARDIDRIGICLSGLGKDGYCHDPSLRSG